MGCAEFEGKVPPLGILELETLAVAQVAAVRAQHLALAQVGSQFFTKATIQTTVAFTIEVECLLYVVEEQSEQTTQSRRWPDLPACRDWAVLTGEAT